mgnify:FL=1
MLQTAFGFTRYSPDDFWASTPREFCLAFEGFLEADKFRRGHKASEVAQLVYGFRDKRPNVRKIMDTLYPEGKDNTVKVHGDMLAQSRAKVRADKAAKARKSD